MEAIGEDIVREWLKGVESMGGKEVREGANTLRARAYIRISCQYLSYLVPILFEYRLTRCDYSCDIPDEKKI
jgi:hypothetical protein